MFGGSRKHRAPVQPLTKETANPNAATAAASAFMRRDPASTTSLSSAAAAAALKARPTTPTNVSQVQSKRSVRRSGSVSSNRSQDRGAGSQLRRTPSNGSMSERTFRSPSPGRSPAPPAYEVPPVPRLPKDEPQRPRSSYHPPTTLQTQPFATASQKLKNGRHSSWFGAARGGDAANVRTADSVLYDTTPHASEPRPGSISPSINFSYPRARHESPAPSTASASEVVMVYDANSRRMVPQVEKIDLIERQHSVRSASEKPVKRKKQKPSRSGFFLSRGSVDRTQAVPVETLQTVAPISAPAQTTSQPAPEASEKVEVVTQPSDHQHEPIPQTQEQKSTADSVAPAEDREATDDARAMPTASSTAAPVLHKKPSTVLEEPETEESIDATETISTKDHAAIDAVPVRSSQATLESTESKPLPEEQPHRHLEPTNQRDSVRRVRVHSESPARSPGRAHFASTTDQLVVRHEPPPRSLSPRKSALKNSSSVRGASPSDDSSEASGPMSSFSKDDSAQARKKAVRVSFNEDYNVVLGESTEPLETDSPIVPSPQVAKNKPWRSFMSRTKRESSPLDEDETMSPRPALPLFGSVREKKTKEPDSERPLVRPAERSWSPPPASASLGPSTDSGIGSILAQETATKNEANISKTREPLPPVVQSIEGNGYLSSSNAESSDDEQDFADSVRKSPTIESMPSFATDITPPTEPASEFVETQQDEKVVLVSPQPETASTSKASTTPTNGSAIPQLAPLNMRTEEPTPANTVQQEESRVPSISVVGATPPARLHPQDSPSKEYFDVPGGFPTDDWTPSATRVARKKETEEPKKAVEPVSVPEPVTAIPESVPPPSPTRADNAASTPPMADIAEEQESSDHSSIYSDAYEDLSDVGMDGFMSLDAVLEAPPKSQVSRLYEKTVNQSKAQASLNGTALPTFQDQDPLKTHDDWENAKVYWRGLTVDKRRQLEREAIEEAGEEADQEATSKPKKTKKRRSTDRPPSSLATTDSARHSERSYQIQPGTSWVQEESHAQSQSEDHSPPTREVGASNGFRKSMRADQPPPVETTKQTSQGMRRSMRSNGTSGDAQPATSIHATTTARPVSYQTGANAGSAKTHRRALSVEGRPTSASGLSGGSLAGASMKPSLRRRDSDSSESSFKRSRSATSEGFGFRRTMRAQSQEVDPPQGAEASGRFSIRSMSPTGSPFRRSMPATTTASPMGGSRMRTSLRAQPSDAKEKKRFSSFGRSSGKKAKKGLGSRFADSSDEEDGRSGPFSSRFAESSDEDDSVQQAPKAQGFAKTMRSPKGTGSPAATSFGLSNNRKRSDSPDLPDSDDDVIRPALSTPKARPTTLRRGSSGRGSLAGASPGAISIPVAERPTHHRRGSFMSSILGRKKDSGGKISRDVSESVARRDTNLERSREELAVLRSNSGGHPRLQKRGSSWPLADENGDSPFPTPATAIDLGQRPATSSGPSTTAPRGFLKRRSLSAQQVPPVPPVPVLPKSQITDLPPERSQVTEVPPEATLKKKKFNKLRKMFGLND